MDFKELGIGFMAWIDLAQNRESFLAFVNTVMNLRVM